jgi:hypothetical protein
MRWAKTLDLGRSEEGRPICCCGRAGATVLKQPGAGPATTQACMGDRMRPQDLHAGLKVHATSGRRRRRDSSTERGEEAHRGGSGATATMQPGSCRRRVRRGRPEEETDVDAVGDVVQGGGGRRGDSGSHDSSEVGTGTVVARRSFRGSGWRPAGGAHGLPGVSIGESNVATGRACSSRTTGSRRRTVQRWPAVDLAAAQTMKHARRRPDTLARVDMAGMLLAATKTSGSAVAAFWRGPGQEGQS